MLQIIIHWRISSIVLIGWILRIKDCHAFQFYREILLGTRKENCCFAQSENDLRYLKKDDLRVSSGGLTVGVGIGEGETEGVGESVGDGVGVGVAIGVGVGEGETIGVGVDVGVGEEEGDGEDKGVGVGVGVGARPQYGS